MASPETEMILRALDDLRDDLSTHRGETRADFAIAFARLNETREMVARLDERTSIDEHEPPPSQRDRVAAVVKQHAPAAGAGALVVALVELVPVIIRAVSGGG